MTHARESRAADVPDDPTGAPERPRRRDLVAHPGFGRLLTVRLSSQWGDGVFQAALGGAVLFNPERESDPAVVALGLAVVLLPYSVLGPFAGALLDRWDRRVVIVTAGVLRTVLTLVTAGVVAAGVTGAPLYLGALATIGVSRFIQAGLSAGLPHVVRQRWLVAANSLVTTSGAIAAAVGATCALTVGGLFGSGDVASGWTTAAAAPGSLLIVAVALGIRRGSLGPDERPADRQGQAARAALAVARGLLDGARAVRATPNAVAAFVAVAAHRMAFGVVLLMTLLLMRHGLTDVGPVKAGVAGIGEMLALTAAGLGVAAVLTPWLTATIGRRGTVRSMLVLAAAGLLALGLPMTLLTVLAGSFVLGLVGQAIKLCSDAVVQRDIADGDRGRVFALSDTTFNVTFVLAVAAAASVVPPDGRSPGLVVTAAALYLLGLAGHEVALRRRADAPHGASQPGSPSPSEVSTAPSPSTSASSTSQRAVGPGPVEDR